MSEKSNEITIVPKLLSAIDLSKTIVTIDAMGCQTAITEKIIEGKGDYIIALKANQKHSLNLAKDMISGFANRERRNIVSRCSTTNEGHGRHEQRDCIVVSYGNIIKKKFKEKFIGLKSIVGITSKSAGPVGQTPRPPPNYPRHPKAAQPPACPLPRQGSAHLWSPILSLLEYLLIYYPFSIHYYSKLKAKLQ